MFKGFGPSALLLLPSMILLAFGTGASASDSGGASDDVITIADSAGRAVEVPYPASSVVVLWSNPAKEIRALGAVDRIVGMD